MKKYELLDESIMVFGGFRLYRIRALRDFSDVKEGDLGGYVEKEDNLSHDGSCWVYEDAWIYDNANVCGGARVFGNACVFGNARVYGSAKVFGNTKVYDGARIFGDAMVSRHVCVGSNSKISGNCILKFNDYTTLYGINLDCGIWTDTVTIDNKKYIISNTLEQLYIGDVE